MTTKKDEPKPLNDKQLKAAEFTKFYLSLNSAKLIDRLYSITSDELRLELRIIMNNGVDSPVTMVFNKEDRVWEIK